MLNQKRVLAGRQIGKRKVAAFVSRHTLLKAGPRLAHHDLHARHDRVAGVDDRTGEAGSDVLRVQQNGGEQSDHNPLHPANISPSFLKNQCRRPLAP